ncbi:MAG: transglutaminase-like domain-containing protein [Solobacterium sp.]|nr:transglutaminase-like domain-containing protein [Solobacterium sp.]
MKKNVSVFLQTFLAVFLSAYGTVFCLVSAYGFSPDRFLLPGWILILSAMLGAVAVLKQRKTVFFAVLVILLAAGWYLRREITAGWMTIAERFLTDLISAYPAFSDLSISVPAADTTAAFLSFSCVSAVICYLALTGTFILPFHIIFSAFAAMLCLLETDKYPSALPLVALTAGMIYPPLTFRDRQENGKASWITAVFLAVCVLVPFLFVQPSGYVRMEWADSFTDRLRNFSEEHAIFHYDEDTGDMRMISPVRRDTAGSEQWNSGLGSVRLSSLGPRSRSEREELQVSTDISGTVYLRGSSWETYENNSWQHLPDETWTLDSSDVRWTDTGPAEAEAHRITVKMPGHISVMYIPYGITEISSSGWPVRDAYLRNTNAVPQYTHRFSRTDTLPQGTAAYRNYVYDSYLQVPETTRAALQQTADALYSADAVCEYVRGSAVYDLDTPSVPAGRDFVTWFLQDSDTGYCVHFASAAVILLRMKGIPARYVSGYMFKAEAGIWNSVQAKHAHAWVEYYIDGIGWRRMDPTPASPQEAGAEEAVQETETPEPQEEESYIPSETDEPAGEPAYEEPVQEKADLSWLKDVLRTVIYILGAAAVFLILKYLRRLYVSYGTVNDRVRKVYRHMRRASRLLRTVPDEDAAQLALEAAFSDRVMTAEDMQKMQGHYAAFLKRCSEKDLWGKILVPLIRL